MWSTCNCWPKKKTALTVIVFCVLSWTAQEKLNLCKDVFAEAMPTIQPVCVSVCVCARVDEVLFCRCLTTVTLCAAWMRVPAVRSHCWRGHCALKPRPKDFPLCPRCRGDGGDGGGIKRQKQKTHSKVVRSSCRLPQQELPFLWIDGAKEESRSPRTTSGLTLWRVGCFFFLGLLYTEVHMSQTVHVAGMLLKALPINL